MTAPLTQDVSVERAYKVTESSFEQLWQDTGFKLATIFGLEEMFRALKESFADLSNEELWAFPVEGRLNIATYVMHCLDTAATFGVHCHTDKRIQMESRWDLYGCSVRGEKPPKPGDSFPTVDEILGKYDEIQTETLRGIEDASEDDLLHPPLREQDVDPRRINAYLRIVFHTLVHVRQVWLLRGAMGLADKKGWPKQDW